MSWFFTAAITITLSAATAVSAYAANDDMDTVSLAKKMTSVEPSISRDQAKEGTFVSKSNLQTGDLVFFTTVDSGKNIGHVGIYVGNGNMIIRTVMVA